jgi:hypothetical protein
MGKESTPAEVVDVQGGHQQTAQAAIAQESLEADQQQQRSNSQATTTLSSAAKKVESRSNGCTE